MLYALSASSTVSWTAVKHALPLLHFVKKKKKKVPVDLFAWIVHCVAKAPPTWKTLAFFCENNLCACASRRTKSNVHLSSIGWPILVWRHRGSKLLLFQTFKQAGTETRPTHRLFLWSELPRLGGVQCVTLLHHSTVIHRWPIGIRVTRLTLISEVIACFNSDKHKQFFFGGGGERGREGAVSHFLSLSSSLVSSLCSCYYPCPFFFIQKKMQVKDGCFPYYNLLGFKSAHSEFMCLR